jgi:hypothetical protein
MTRLERHEQALLRLVRKNIWEEAKQNPGKFTSQGGKSTRKKTITPRLDFMESEALPFTAPEQHHHISHSRNFPINITSFLASNKDDPATEVCSSWSN